MLTYSMLLQMLKEAEARRDNTDYPKDVRARATESVKLCEKRMKMEGISREELIVLARSENAPKKRCAA